MTTVFTAQEAFTDLTLPKLKVDSILPDGDGALALFIPSITPSLTLPAGASTIDNLAWERAKVLIPAATEASLRGITNKNFSSGASGIAEFSAKRGIHVINSQTVSAKDQGYSINLPDDIRSYLIANQSNKYFFSLWGKTSRATLDTTEQYSVFGIVGSNINNTKLSIFATTTHAPSGSALGNRVGGAFTSVSNFIRNQAVNGFSSVVTAPTLGNLLAYIQFGSRDVFNNTHDVNKASSGIIYKFYMEDLTVSGRTYAEVDAIDFALYTAAFAVGGKYYGDTFTAPSTIV